jgi:2-aminoadipate transaminase
MPIAQLSPPIANGAGPWTGLFAHRLDRVKASTIRELLKLLTRPEVISFAGGLPAPELFPIEEIEAATRRVLAERGREALQYGTTEGYLPLRELLVRHMRRYGVEVTPANVLITTGSQQALDLVGRAFLDPGDTVLVEAPTYLGALQAFNICEPAYVTVPLDDDGVDPDAIERELDRRRPKFLYLLPNFHNPAGVTLSLERRRRIVELAARRGVPIVEDDPYGQLRYEGEHLPPLVVLDAELRRDRGTKAHAGGGVIYLGTLSKTLAPGLRIGWVVAPEPVIDRLVRLKQGADLHTATFTQMIAHETARGGFVDRHVRRLREVYRERRDAMLAALERHMPPGTRWTHPAGGLFLWMTLPAGLDSTQLLPAALAFDVAYVAGAPFFAAGGGERTLRLNFSYCPPATIAEGIRRLGEVVSRAAAS